MTQYTRSLALQLTLEGMTLREIGFRLGVSKQRVYQLLKPPAEITQEIMARTKGRCEGCGILARPAHVHARDIEREINGYKGKGMLRLLCLSCARQAHQKRRGR